MKGSIRHKFRTALVGGFNRRDVADYIESTTKKLGDDIDALKNENQELNAAKAEAELQVSRHRVQLLDVTAQLKAANEQLEAAKAELEEAKAELEETRNQLEELKNPPEPQKQPRQEETVESEKVPVQEEKSAPSGRDILRGISVRRKS